MRAEARAMRPLRATEPYRALPEADVLDIVKARKLACTPTPFPLSSQGEARDRARGPPPRWTRFCPWRESLTGARRAARAGSAFFLRHGAGPLFDWDCSKVDHPGPADAFAWPARKSRRPIIALARCGWNAKKAKVNLHTVRRRVFV